MLWTASQQLSLQLAIEIYGIFGVNTWNCLRTSMLAPLLPVTLMPLPPLQFIQIIWMQPSSKPSMTMTTTFHLIGCILISRMPHAHHFTSTPTPLSPSNTTLTSNRSSTTSALIFSILRQLFYMSFADFVRRCSADFRLRLLFSRPLLPLPKH